MKDCPDTFSANDPPIFHKGRWVVVQGLQSTTGQNMNGKVAYVNGDKKDGRLPVMIDGIIGGKLLKPENLNTVSISEEDFLLVAFLSDERRWEFMRGRATEQLIA